MFEEMNSGLQVVPELSFNEGLQVVPAEPTYNDGCWDAFYFNTNSPQQYKQFSPSFYPFQQLPPIQQHIQHQQQKQQQHQQQQQQCMHPQQYFFPNVGSDLSRASHNVLERHRRNDLKIRFNVLRDNIPELIDNKKSPKIQILNKARDYIRKLNSEDQKILVDLELEKQHKKILQRKLMELINGERL